MPNIFWTPEEGDIELGEEIGSCYVARPDDYFLLDVFIPVAMGPDRDPPIPEVIRNNLGKIKTGAQWEALGLTPYTVETHYASGAISKQFGGVVVENRNYSFTPYDALCDQKAEAKWKQAMAKDRRLIEHPWQAYQLRKLGIPFTEMADINGAIEKYTKARLAADEGNFAEAVVLLTDALAINKNRRDYQELLLTYRTKAGDASVIQDGLMHYCNDMDSAVHSGKAEKWLRLALDQCKSHALALDIALTVLNGLDMLLSTEGKIKKRIHGSQSKVYYSKTRQKFLLRLSTLRGFLGKELLECNQDRQEDLRKILTDILLAAPAKADKIVKVQALLG